MLPSPEGMIGTLRSISAITFVSRRRLPGRDIRRIAPGAAKTVEGGLCCELRQPNEFGHSSALQLSQSHRFDAMRLAFAQDQIGAIARGQDVFLQVHEVDGAPKLQRLGDRLRLRQL